MALKYSASNGKGDSGQAWIGALASSIYVENGFKHHKVDQISAVPHTRLVSVC